MNSERHFEIYMRLPPFHCHNSTGKLYTFLRSLLHNIQCEIKRNEVLHALLGPAGRLLPNVTKLGRKK
jgi:hypothetical protein